MRHVLAALAGRETPVTAQELFIELRDNGHSLGLATVYRALHVLRDDGRLHEFHVEDGIAFRACAPEPHHHLVCLQCGRVQENTPPPWATGSTTFGTVDSPCKPAPSRSTAPVGAANRRNETDGSGLTRHRNRAMRSHRAKHGWRHSCSDGPKGGLACITSRTV